MAAIPEGISNNPQSQFPFSITNITNFVSTQLNGDNYLIWKHQLVTILKTLDLLPFIDPTSSPPPGNSPDFSRWLKIDSYVSACINATLHESVAHLAINTSTASELWSNIEESYLQQAFARKSQLKTQLQLLKQGSLKINEYCDLVKKISNNLRAIGEEISDNDLVLHTLSGLSPVYNDFVMNVENQEKSPSFFSLNLGCLFMNNGWLNKTHNLLLFLQ